MNILGGLDKPSAGSVVIDNQKISRLNTRGLTKFRRNNIGFIFQDFNLIQVLNVYENIVLPLRLGRKPIDDQIIDEILSYLNLSDIENKYPSQLSGGEQQRVAIIRAIVSKPKLILADEPTGNLDKKNSDLVIKLIQSMCKKFNRTVIIVTHNKDVAYSCDRVLEIESGCIIEKVINHGQ